jgi:glycosyltransferase involved in cell wall biosynthesis
MNRAERIKLMIIVPSMHAGGSEKVILHLVNNLNRNLFDIRLLVLNKSGALLQFLPVDISIVYMNYQRTMYAVPGIIRAVRTHRPQIVLSTLGHLNLIIATIKWILPRQTLLVARESSIISIRNKDERYPRLFDFLFRTVYHRFHLIICQSNYMKDDLRRHYNVPLEKMVVINNPVDFSQLPARQIKGSSENVKLLSIGQIRPEKGYPRLIEALSKCEQSFHYTIIGGGDVSKLKALAASHAIDQNITFAGQILNPFSVLASSSCLLLGSHYEGFPNVVLEANACGIPVIAYNSPGGHNEIIRNGENGWLIESADELCALIESRAFDSLDRAKIIQMTKERYNMARIVGQYEEAFISRLHPVMSR